MISTHQPEDAVAFREKLHVLQAAVSAALAAETAAKDELLRCRQQRREAQHRLYRFIETDSKPLPLFDCAETSSPLAIQPTPLTTNGTTAPAEPLAPSSSEHHAEPHPSSHGHADMFGAPANDEPATAVIPLPTVSRKKRTKKVAQPAAVEATLEGSSPVASHWQPDDLVLSLLAATSAADGSAWALTPHAKLPLGELADLAAAEQGIGAGDKTYAAVSRLLGVWPKGCHLATRVVMALRSGGLLEAQP